MPTDCISDQVEFEGFDGRKVVAAFDGGAITSDAGALLLRHTDSAIGLFDRVAACFADQRDPACTVHSVRTLVGQRIAAICNPRATHAPQNRHRCRSGRPAPTL